MGARCANLQPRRRYAGFDDELHDVACALLRKIRKRRPGQRLELHEVLDKPGS